MKMWLRFQHYFILLFALLVMPKGKANPINAFAPHLMAHPGFMHPAMIPMYPLQYPTYPVDQQASGSSPEEQTQTNQANPSKDTKKEDEEDDDVNKRDDDETFWEAASSYGRNRWTNFRDGFTELWDVFRAAGRGFRNVFSSD